MISIEKASYNPQINALRFAPVRKFSHYGDEAKRFLKLYKHKALIVFGPNGEVIKTTMAYHKETERVKD